MLVCRIHPWSNFIITKELNTKSHYLLFEFWNEVTNIYKNLGQAKVLCPLLSFCIKYTFSVLIFVHSVYPYDKLSL